MMVLKEFANCKTGLALLLGLAIAIWLSPLPASSIVVIFVATFALVHRITAAISVLLKGLRALFSPD